MAKSAKAKTVVPKKKRKAPEAHPQHIDKNVADVGVREVTRIVDGPRTVQTDAGPMVSPGTPVRVTEKVAQPYLTEEEAIGLGKLVWHQYTGPLQPDDNGKRPIVYTTVVNSRRFMVTAKIFAALEKGGMAEQNG